MGVISVQFLIPASVWCEQRLGPDLALISLLHEEYYYSHTRIFSVSLSLSRLLTYAVASLDLSFSRDFFRLHSETSRPLWDSSVWVENH